MSRLHGMRLLSVRPREGGDPGPHRPTHEETGSPPSRGRTEREKGAKRSAHRDDADAVADFDFGPVFRRQPLNALEDAIRNLASRRHRPAALSARPLVAEIDRMDADLGEPVGDEIAHRKRLFPLRWIACVSPCAALITRFDEVGRSGPFIETVALISFGRHVFHQLDLEDEGADAVQQRLAVIDFDGHRRLRTMRHENIGAGLDAAATVLEREVGDVLDVAATLCGEQGVAALFVPVEARDHAVRHAARRFHLSDVLPKVDRVRFGLDRELVAEAERLAEEIVAVARALLVGVALVAAPLEVRLPADAPADLAQLGKRGGIDLIDLLVPEPVDAGMAQRVIALVAGARTAPELARGCNQRDASARGF